MKRLSQQEISKLKSQVEVEKQRRLTIQEDKIEKSSALMQELYERDKKIVQLKNENRELRSENEELDSVSQNYYELRGPLSTRSGKNNKGPPSSQNMYSLRGNQKKNVTKTV